MTPHPRLSRAAIELVKRYEGLRRRAARLDAGGWTIGYGHTVSAREGAVVTEEEAELLLIYDLGRVAAEVEALVKVPLNANQFNGLIAFAFNIGLDHFRNSAVLTQVNQGAFLRAAAAMEMWRRAAFEGGAPVVDGLIRRRAAEKALFLAPRDGSGVTPTPVVRPVFDDPDLHRPGPAVSLHVPLDGDRAAAVAAPEPVAETEPVSAATPPQTEPEPEPAEPGPLDLAAPPFPFIAPEPEPEPSHEPPPPPMAEAAPVQHVFEPPPRRTFEEDIDEALDVRRGPGISPRYETIPERGSEHGELPMVEFGRRRMGEAQPASANPTSAYAVLVIGLLGALMFLGALLAMVYGRATLVNLGVGLVGVVCMVPAGLRLLLGLFGERPPEH